MEDMYDYKKVITKNGNTYIGYFISNNIFKTTFGWTLDINDIDKIEDY